MIQDNIMRQLEVQLNSVFAGGGQDFVSIRAKIDMAYERCIEALSACIDKHLNPDGKPRFSLYNSDCWSIFLYYLSNCLKDEKDGSAEKIFYLNKVLHSVDWYYEIELPPHFIVAHPLGSVLGRATYGDYLCIYQGVTVGGNGTMYPVIGNNVMFYSNAKVLGNAHIGNNVVFSANSYVINEDIPDDCIVFGSSPNLIIKHDKNKVNSIMKEAWRHYL